MSTSPKVYFAGEKGAPLPSSTGHPVKIDEIRKKFNKAKLYEDPDFPASQKSVGDVGGDISASSGAAAKGAYKWLRPHEICKSMGIAKPDFATNKENLCDADICSEYDLVQGGLGDCWYLAAVTALTKRDDQLKWVIPEDNFHGFEEGKYCGAFHFRFYSMSEAKWVDIVIDDRLACTQKSAKNPMMIPAFTSITNKPKNATVAEFWPALMEKAYAKFIGSYKLIEGGFASQALEDFTAGFSEIIDFKESLDDHNVKASSPLSKYEALKKKIQGIIKSGDFMSLGTYSPTTAYQNGVLEGYSCYDDTIHRDGTYTHKLQGYKYNPTTKKVELDPDPKNKSLGLVGPHAYTVLDAQEVKRKDGKKAYFLLKIRNPHATHEWSGPFADSDDKNWKYLEKDLRMKSRAGSCHVDEGIFWMELNDVIKYFSRLFSCYSGMKDGTKFTMIKGAWSALLQKKAIPYSKGGLRHLTAYKFEAKRELHKLKIPAEYGNKCIVAFTIVMSGYSSIQKPKICFTFFLYKVIKEDLAQPLTKLYEHKEPITMGYRNIGREESKWIFLEPGTYIIVPLLVTSPNAETTIPKEFIGLDIPFTIHLFTENETTLEAIPPGK